MNDVHMGNESDGECHIIGLVLCEMIGDTPVHNEYARRNERK